MTSPPPKDPRVTMLVSLAALTLLLLASCARPPAPPVEVPPPQPPVTPVLPPVEVPPPQPLQKVAWETVDGWHEDDPSQALEAFRQSCTALKWRTDWQPACTAAAALGEASPDEIRSYFEIFFEPHLVRQEDGTTEGLVTGYYVPDLDGSREASGDYPYPLYQRPDDLLVIDLTDVYPELGNYRLRGRLDGLRVIPYWDREGIDGEAEPLAGQELFWVADPVELFFLHIQGSGRIVFEDGSHVMVNYAEQNGHPYRSIGRYMIDNGIMSRHQMSMQNIRAWARKNRDQVDDLLNQNPSYVFFRALPDGVESPPGALGVPLTPGRSLAVDPRTIPLGAPVFLETTWPNTDHPLQRLMVAQDTGGAIKGRARGDFFWGMGERAGELAGRMKQAGRFWVLLPKTDAEEE